MASRIATREDLNEKMKSLFDALNDDGKATLLENILVPIAAKEVDRKSVVHGHAKNLREFALRLLTHTDELDVFADQTANSDINLKHALALPDSVTGGNKEGAIVVNVQRGVRGTEGKKRKVTTPNADGSPSSEEGDGEAEVDNDIEEEVIPVRNSRKSQLEEALAD